MTSIAMGIRRIRLLDSKSRMVELRLQDQARMQIQMHRPVLWDPMVPMASADSARRFSAAQLVRCWAIKQVTAP